VSDNPGAFFVYGTLKRGQPNHRLLAPFVRSSAPGYVLGALYDTFDYPVLTDGSDMVHGDLLRLSPPEMERALEIVDRFEEYVSTAPAMSLFERRVVEVHIGDGEVEVSETERAYAYFYNAACGIPPVQDLPRIPEGNWL